MMIPLSNGIPSEGCCTRSTQNCTADKGVARESRSTVGNVPADVETKVASPCTQVQLSCVPGTDNLVLSLYLSGESGRRKTRSPALVPVPVWWPQDMSILKRGSPITHERGER